jgi:alpha-tubulin suppressor-like RCC1 family protein
MTTFPRMHRASFDKQESHPSADAARALLQTALRLHEGSDTLELRQLKALLQRCRELDALRLDTAKDNPFESQILIASNNDSGYTPLHEAVYRGDLCRILFLLRQATGVERMTWRPMELLHLNNNNNTLPRMREMANTRDNEGLTPAALLAVLQRRELAACRASLERLQAQQSQRREGRSRSNSLFEELSEANEDEQNEFDLLSRAMRVSQRQPQSDYSIRDDDSEALNSDESSSNAAYGCEVFTFGRAHHCALGVVASNRHQDDPTRTTDKTKSQQLRPHRVQAFAQDTVGRAGAAIAVASATYHTLTVTAAGELYAFGLGKGGRLGTGDEKPCATPVRVRGPLLRQIVVSVAAAENHSLCATEKGHVYAFGSNRFGQLGTINSKLNADDTTSRCLPRRVDDLKQVMCVSVAAGARHSVALSQSGEVYVWGDNSSGQLGISGRCASNNNTMHKAQRVEALWKAAHGPKVAIAIAASEQATLVLTSGSGQRGLPVNSVYSWGHGNHVPCKVHFGSGCSSRAINPVAISSARYHNIAITSEGEVYSWGLHADSLGMSPRGARQQLSSLADADTSGAFALTDTASLTAPQLVTGMLPENGGGKVVAAAASENHTAVVTESGHLWTWGDTYKQNVLGHEGVRWQPEPKRVPGVHRAVSVSAAKEHTVLLIGVIFPPLPSVVRATPESSIPSLEILAARTIARHCDLFNVLPILITAERTQTSLLLDYCKEFVRLNLDGILNVGQKSAMDCYLNEQLDGSSLESFEEKDFRDGRHKPFLTDVVLAGSDSRLAFGQEKLCSVDNWLRACENLSRRGLVASIMTRNRTTPLTDGESSTTTSSREQRSRLRSLSSFENTACSASDRLRIRNDSFGSERCDELTLNMDISSKDHAEARLACLTKEVRAIRKRLSQITRLVNSEDSVPLLTEDQQRKIARRVQLEADLFKFGRAIETVEARLRKFNVIDIEIKGEQSKDVISEKTPQKESDVNEPLDKKDVMSVKDVVIAPLLLLRCEICQITCPDEKSHELHMNGRKHRNRTTQVAEEDKKQAAVSMIEEQQRQLLLRPTRQTPPRNAEFVNSPWGTSGPKGSVHPKYTLPPPPHPIADTVASPFAAASNTAVIKSLREIMEEESRQSKTAFKASSTPKKGALQLPPGSAQLLKSPPWSTTKDHATVVTGFPSTSVAAMRRKPTYSLGVFIEKPAPKVDLARPQVRWTTPKTMPFSKETTHSVSFRDIQQQEEEFKSKQDQTYGGNNGKWFIEQRERAASLKEIQGETAKEVEERLFVEEQMRIEKQIYEEVVARKADEEKQSQKRPRKPRKKSNAGRNGNEQPSESGHTAKTRNRQRKIGSKAGAKGSCGRPQEPPEQPKQAQGSS